MIIFVDEDMGPSTAYPLALELRGIAVETLPDAATALERLPSKDFDLVIIDVMLAPGLVAHDCFSDAQTRGGLETGLRLLEQLVRLDEKRFANRAVLLSAAENGKLLESIKASSVRHKVPFWTKSEFRSPTEFCRRVQVLLDALNGRAP
ncbi:MAG: hypothetical protein ACKVWR_02540 [Acidimicrobiales bacterium]